MPSDVLTAGVDWRPYRFTALVLGLAIVFNLWVGNGVWLWYSTLGLGALLWLIGLARMGKFRAPTRTLWIVGAAMSLHYLGGSLSGLHQVGGPNGLYYAFPWWDNVVHVLGSIGVAAMAAAWAQSKMASRAAAAFVAVCIACTIGVAVELYEFAQFVWFGTVDQGYYTNTLLDLYNNLLGAAVGAFLQLRATPARPVPQDPAL